MPLWFIKAEDEKYQNLNSVGWYETKEYVWKDWNKKLNIKFLNMNWIIIYYKTNKTKLWWSTFHFIYYTKKKRIKKLNKIYISSNP